VPSTGLAVAPGARAHTWCPRPSPALKGVTPRCLISNGYAPVRRTKAPHTTRHAPRTAHQRGGERGNWETGTLATGAAGVAACAPPQPRPRELTPSTVLAVVLGFAQKPSAEGTIVEEAGPHVRGSSAGAPIRGWRGLTAHGNAAGGHRRDGLTAVHFSSVMEERERKRCQTIKVHATVHTPMLELQKTTPTLHACPARDVRRTDSVRVTLWEGMRGLVGIRVQQDASTGCFARAAP
jgi:hypothetical protein